MKNAIMLSIRPEWVAKILNGEKTIEIRKTAPKCDLPIDVYIYCTKDNRYLIDRRVVSNGEYEAITLGEMHDPNKTVNITPESECVLNGKVVAKFALREVTQYINGCNVSKDSGYMFGDAEREGVYEKSCLSDSDIDEYCPDESFYAWHISDLVIFDKPKDLSDFGLKRAPQSWQYVEEEK